MTVSTAKLSFWQRAWNQVVPAEAKLIRSSFFWQVTGASLLITATFAVAFGGFDSFLPAMFMLWLVLVGTYCFIHRHIFRNQAPSMASNPEKWDAYDNGLRALRARLTQRHDQVLQACIAANKAGATRNWKCGALASATVTIRSRSYFSENEERTEESAISSQSNSSK